MNILDENILTGQRQLLRGWRIKVYQIGYDISKKGIQDEEIIPFLLTQHQPTFFTCDLGFYQHKLCHPGYCLVCLAIQRNEAATFVRRILRHPKFNTKAKRVGTVIRASSSKLQVWRLHAEKEVLFSWDARLPAQR